MPQITWRNIDAPDLTAESNMIQRIQNTFNGIGNSLTQSIQDYRTQQDANVNILRKNNVEAFKDLLSTAKTPEELAALQNSGALAQKLASFNGVYDPSAVRDLDTQRMTSLRDQVLKGQEYANTQTDLADAPIWEKIYERAQVKDRPGVDKLLAENNLRLEGQRAKDVYSILNGYDKFALTKNQDSRDAARLGMSRELHNATMADRKRKLDDENAFLKAQREAANIGEVYNSGLRSTQDKLQQLYKYANLSPNQVDADGNVIPDSLTPDQKKILSDGSKDIEAESQASVLQRAKQMFLDNPAYQRFTQEQRDSLLGIADNSLYGLKALSKEEQETKANSKALIERSLKSNPYFASADTDPIASINTILDKHKIKTDDGKLLFGETDDDERKAYTSEAIGLSTSGLAIQTPKGTEYVKIPPAIIDMYLSTVEGGYFEINGSLTDGIRDWIEQGSPNLEQSKAESKNMLTQSLENLNFIGMPVTSFVAPTKKQRDATQSQVYKWNKEYEDSRKQLDTLNAQFSGKYNPQLSNKVNKNINALKKLNREVTK